MNVLGSECSSGCESGWTLYLEEHSSHRNGNGHDCCGFCEENYYEEKKCSVNKANNNEHGGDDDDDADHEEEDLSMVSDASSGPQHFNNEDEVTAGCCYFNDVNKATTAPAIKLANNNNNNNGGNNKRLKKKEKRRLENEKLPSFLDDTASSPFVNFSSKNDEASMELGYSQAFSATHFQQERPAFQEHFGFLQPSLSGNHLQNNQWY